MIETSNHVAITSAIAATARAESDLLVLDISPPLSWLSQPECRQPPTPRQGSGSPFTGLETQGMFRARWRRLIRERTPGFLYDHGLVIPKVKDCRDHEWYVASAEHDACYHCLITRESPSLLMEQM